MLEVDPETVDVHRFQRLTAAARAAADGDAVMALLDEALALWRGEAFAALDTPWLNAARAGLDRARLAAELDAAGGYETHAWQLAWALATFLDRRAHWGDRATTHAAALAAAGRLTDPCAQAYATRRSPTTSAPWTCTAAPVTGPARPPR